MNSTSLPNRRTKVLDILFGLCEGAAHERGKSGPGICGRCDRSANDLDSVYAAEQPNGHTTEWYVMEVRHRNAVIGIAKQYLIDGEPERALAILRQVQNGIGDAAAAKMPKQTEQTDSHVMDSTAAADLALVLRTPDPLEGDIQQKWIVLRRKFGDKNAVDMAADFLEYLTSAKDCCYNTHDPECPNA